MILPKKWQTKLRPVCLHLAGTGDHVCGRHEEMCLSALNERKKHIRDKNLFVNISLLFAGYIFVKFSAI